MWLLVHHRVLIQIAPYVESSCLIGYLSNTETTNKVIKYHDSMLERCNNQQNSDFFGVYKHPTSMPYSAKPRP